MKNKKQNLNSELIESGLDAKQAEQFFDNMNFVGKALDEYQPVPSQGFNDRIKAAVNAKLDSNTNTIAYFNPRIKSIVAAAAMLLLVFSLVFYQMGPNDRTVATGDGVTDAVAINDVSVNPFAQPDLVMEVLMDQQGANSIDGMTLEAVSAMWGQENQKNQDDSSSSQKGKNNENIA